MSLVELEMQILRLFSLKSLAPCAAERQCLHLRQLSGAGFRHSAGFHARVILDGAACRLR